MQPLQSQVMLRILLQICIITHHLIIQIEYRRCHRRLALIIALRSIYRSMAISGKINIELRSSRNLELNITMHRQLILRFSNLGIKNITMSADYVKDYDRLHYGGIWCILQLDYEFIEEDKKNIPPIRIRKLTPIQMPHVDMDEVKNGRKAFTKEEWMDILLR